jgi:hypothetical protein
VALAIIDVFLRLNGAELTADEMDAVDTIQSLAAGDLSEEQLADWIAAHSAPARSVLTSCGVSNSMYTLEALHLPRDTRPPGEA